MLAFSRERVPEGTPALCAVCVGEFETPDALFMDVLIYREALKPGTYTLAHNEKTWSFELPAGAASQGFPGCLFRVQVDLKEPHATV